MLKVDELVSLMKRSENRCPLFIENYNNMGNFMSIGLNQYEQYREIIGDKNVTSIGSYKDSIFITIDN